jgi:hypothetical protein
MLLRCARLSSVLAFAYSTLLFSSLSAQQPKVLAPHKPIPPLVTNGKKWLTPATLRSMVGGLWMMDANFKSTIYLRNDVETDPVTVTPILWLSNGKRFTLDDVTLEPAGISVININQELSNKGLASWATLMGYVEIQYTWPWDALCVSVWNVDASHSLILTSDLGPIASPTPQAAMSSELGPSQILQGLWWKQEPNVSGFVTLSNTFPVAVHATVQVTDTAGNTLGTHPVSLAPHGTKRMDLPELQGASSNAGGIRIAYAGPAGAVLPNGALEDQAAGYSARMRFIYSPPASAKSSQESFVELGLMTGAADPMMLFPAGTTFAPYSIVSNVSDQPIRVIPALWWMQAAVPHSAPLPALTVLPGRTQNLDVPSLLSLAGLKNFNGSVNLVLDVQGPARGLLIASGSVDQKNTYVFEVTPTTVHESIAKSFSYWSIANGDDTMVTVWNPADEAQDFKFTLFYTGGHYDFPIHLAPRVTNTFKISEIIHSQIPDAEGNLVPASVRNGSARIAGAHDTAESILVNMAAGTYNVVKATCGEGCTTCDGWTYGSEIDVSPLGMSVGGTDTVKFIVPFKDGNKRDYTAQSTWKTDNTSIATVQSAGVIKGMTAGKFTTTVTGPELGPALPCCNLTGGCCAPPSPPQGSGPGNVAPVITGGNTVWWFNGQDPDSSTYPISVTLMSSGGSSTTWTVTQADMKVSLSSTSGSSITVKCTGSKFSAASGDISITATAGGVPSTAFTMTSRTPWKLSLISRDTVEDSKYVYITNILYNVLDNLSSVVASDINWNEIVGACQSANGSNWGPICISSSSGSTGPLTDLLGGPPLASNPSPKPQYDNPPTGSTPYENVPQTINVGSSTTGGVLAQTDTLTYYIDQGNHTGITQPPQPPN